MRDCFITSVNFPTERPHRRDQRYDGQVRAARYMPAGAAAVRGAGGAAVHARGAAAAARAARCLARRHARATGGYQQ